MIMAPTTIPVREVTRQRLQRIREETGAASYDEVIQRLIAEVRQAPDSLFGANHQAKPFRKGDRATLHDL
jgi:hypothetical protein